MIHSILRLLKKTKRKVFPSNRHCILCTTNLDKFNPLPSIYINKSYIYNYPYSVYDAETLNVDEYTCPNCGCLDRERLYVLYLNKNINPNRQYKILDIAPSKGLKLFLKKKSNVSYRSADLFMTDVDDKVDITDMPIYRDNSFDIFICSHILEHVSDDQKAMKELRRILKPDGFGIAMVPINLAVKEIDEDPSIEDVNERWRRFGQDDHVRLYSKAGYIKRLKDTGFKVEELGIDYFGKRQFEVSGINPRSILYIVKK